MPRRTLALSCCLLAASMCLHPAPARAQEPAGTFPGGIVLAKSYGPPFPAMEDTARDGSGAPTLVVQQGFGCLILGTTGTAAAVGASTLNVVQNIAGGLVAPTNPTVLALGLVGVVFATYCSIGAAMTPLYLYLTGSGPEPSPPAATEARTRPTPAAHRTPLGSAPRHGVLGDALARRQVPPAR